MEMERIEEVVEFITTKLFDNLESFKDFVIVGDSKAVLSKIEAEAATRENERYAELKVSISRMLYSHAEDD
jgi:hypothetical protein